MVGTSGALEVFGSTWNVQMEHCLTMSHWNACHIKRTATRNVRQSQQPCHLGQPWIQVVEFPWLQPITCGYSSGYHTNILISNSSNNLSNNFLLTVGYTIVCSV